MKPRYKPIDRPECEDTWFCYFVAPKGQGQPSAIAKPLSQVPDLNQGRKSTTSGTENRRTQVRGAANPNDSNYIHLAKAGGRKNLLTFTESKAKGPVPYPMPEWYYDNFPDHDSNTVKRDSTTRYPQRPDWMTHLEYDQTTYQHKTPYHASRGIIAWDKMSAWKREEFDKRMQQKAKATYEKKRREERQERKKKHDVYSKVNSTGLTEGARVRLPKIEPKNLPGMRKLSGADLKVHWYEKWYITNRA
ncbi:uncharacterized protein LOC116286571 [Actinia tenebrosa]|uniref:Uncharacterized protein LOC116286571 n=1 Tax=Actinia tenebrosa TaxID=6105 RepID=A0A6P8GZS1_ACTTE|nr:uncharacterized protein LOC116286571 [Actinia tenebrosa]